MTPKHYQQFTQQLQTALENDPRVVGLVALGSMAGQGRQPDEWSDHDFFVVVESGTQEDFRQNLNWLPDTDHIVFSFRETAHGLKVVFDYGHLIEFAVFDLEELHFARVNLYRVLFDRADISQRMSGLHEKTTFEAQQGTDEHYFGQLLTHLMIGAARYARGEQLSGHRFIKHHAVADILWLLAKYLPAADKSTLDNLDPFRRFEHVFPEVGAELNQIMLLEPRQATDALLTLADKRLRPAMPNYPVPAVTAIQAYLATIPKPA